MVFYHNKLGGLTESASSYVSPDRQEHFEEITDQGTDVKRSHWNSFEHYKEFIDLDSSSDFAFYVWYFDGIAGVDTLRLGVNPDPWHAYVASSFGDPGKLSYYLDNSRMYSKRADGGFIPPPPDLESLKQRSLQTMLPLIKAELSLPNSLIELRDFSSLPRTLSLVREAISGLFLVKKGVRAPGAAASIGRIAKATADSYLQAKFNLLPLLSDITGIRAALSRTERKINRFITMAGRVQVKHFRALTELDLVDSERTFTFPRWPDTSHVPSFTRAVRNTQYVYYDPTVFHAEIQYNYNYTGYQVAHARLLALLDAVGCNFNPAVIWNAIPWSFVIDWVFGVSRFLDQYKGYLMEPKINIHRYLWSVSRKRRIFVQREITDQDFVYRYGEPRVGSINTPTVYATSYRRHVERPEHSSIISSGLSPTEFSLGAALVVSRRRPRKSKRW